MTRALDVLLAAEAPVLRPGGAERFALELLERLEERGHRCRALVLGDPGPVTAWRALSPGLELIEVRPPADGGGYWGRRLRRAESLQHAVAGLLAEDPADVVLGQLECGWAPVRAAEEAGLPSALLLAGYEALCHWAFVPSSHCLPDTRCRDCPRALALTPPERADLLLVRARHDAALAAAALLVAPSQTMARACERIIGRRPRVAAPVVRAPAAARPLASGPAVLVSSVWSVAKGVELLAPIARRIPDRPVLIQAPNGLEGPTRSELTTLANVTVSESATEIGSLLDGAAMVLVPSQLPEPFGRVAFEALAAGVPTLASATGGLAEFVPPEQLVSRFGDPDAWAAAVRALERDGAWEAARARGRAAAARILASDPSRRIESWLQEAVVAGVSGPAWATRA